MEEELKKKQAEEKEAKAKEAEALSEEAEKKESAETTTLDDQGDQNSKENNEPNAQQAEVDSWCGTLSTVLNAQSILQTFFRQTQFLKIVHNTCLHLHLHFFSIFFW